MPGPRDAWPAAKLCRAPHPLADGSHIHCQRWPSHEGHHRTLGGDHEWTDGQPCPADGCGSRGPRQERRRVMALSTTTAMTIRLPVAMADDLKLVADCDGEPVIDAIRVAVSRYIDWRKTDPNFQQALRARVEHAQSLISEEA